MKIHVRYYIDLKPEARINIKVKKERMSYKALFCLALALALLINLPMLYAYEAHIINVTAEICNYSETRTMGYWKNHPERFLQCNISQVSLGEDVFDLSDFDPESETGVQALLYIFENAKAQDMINMVKGQLLAMKFNVACFGIGDYFYEPYNKNIDDIIIEADALIAAHVPEDRGDREALENVKDILDTINNMHTLKYCSETPQGFEPVLNTLSPMRFNRLLESLNIESIVETETQSDNNTFLEEPESVIETETQSDEETFKKDKDNKGKKDNPLGSESILEITTESNEETLIIQNNEPEI